MTDSEDRKKARKRGVVAQKQEAEWWVAQGFFVEGNFKHARYIGPGKLILIPHDLFADPKTGRAGFDHIAVYPGRPTVLVGIQTTTEPFLSTKGGDTADRNARHGPPPLDWPAPLIGVEEWVARVQVGDLVDVPKFVQVLASYSEPREPERRWWVRKG